jgi:hypothetical protein
MNFLDSVMRFLVGLGTKKESVSSNANPVPYDRPVESLRACQEQSQAALVVIARAFDFRRPLPIGRPANRFVYVLLYLSPLLSKLAEIEAL